MIDLDESLDDDTPINPSQIINYSPTLPSIQIQQLSELDNYAYVGPNLPDILDMFESRESRDPRLRARSTNLVVGNFQSDSSSRESQLVLVERTINIPSNVFQNRSRDQASTSKQKRACADKREE